MLRKALVFEFTSAECLKRTTLFTRLQGLCHDLVMTLNIFFSSPDTVLFQHVWTLVAARQGLATGFWATDEDDLYHLIPEKSPSWFRASKYGPFTVSVLFHPNSDDPWSSMSSVPSFIFPEKNDIEWSSQFDGKTWWNMVSFSTSSPFGKPPTTAFPESQGLLSPFILQRVLIFQEVSPHRKFSGPDGMPSARHHGA